VLFLKSFQWFHHLHKLTVAASDVCFHPTSSSLKMPANRFNNLDRSPSGGRLRCVVQGHDQQRVTIAACHPQGIAQRG
jgi:hypothetical protein